MSYVKYPNRAFITLAVILALVAYLYMRYYQQVGLSLLSSHGQNVRFLDSKIDVLMDIDFETFYHTEFSKTISLEYAYAVIDGFIQPQYAEGKIETQAARDKYERVKQEVFSWRAHYSQIFVRRNDDGNVFAIDFWITSNPSFPPPYFINQACPNGNCPRIYRYTNPALDRTAWPERTFEEDFDKVPITANWYYMHKTKPFNFQDLIDERLGR
ncbi:MAG: hypothetical protein AAF267_13210 [Deinococcota bacterium]